MKISTQKAIGVFSASLLTTAAAVYIYSPVIGTHADSSATADVNLSVSEVMSLTLDKNALDLSASLYSFTSGTVTATASTNSQYGYTLTLEDVDSSSDMTHTNTEITSKLTSDFSGKKTSAEMDNNTWGFSLDATDFYKVPVNGSPVALKRTTTPMTTDSESTDVTFGAKVGNITSGTYTDKVLFTMYVNGQDGKPTNPDDPSNPPADPSEPGAEPVTACTGKNYVTNGILTDPRDGNTYTVAELADGKCWMTQNLRITNKTISSADSDIDNTLGANYTFTIPESNVRGFDMFENYNSAYYDSTHDTGYYTWYTATAGIGSKSLTNVSVPISICPKGWRLPWGGEMDGFNDFKRLYNVYGLSENYSANVEQMFNGTPSFTAHGYVDYSTLYDSHDITSGYWSATAGDTASSAYILGTSITQYSGFSTKYNFYPKIMGDKGNGNAVRCIAR